MLHADSVAQAKSTEGIVGLDWEPFLGSQDPDEHFRVGKVISKGSSYLVEVHSVRAGKISPHADVTAEIAGSEGHWYFVNFHYPLGVDLLGSLREFAKDRAKTHPQS